MKRKVAILYGGISSEHEISILSGKNVFENIDKSRYHPALIEISKTGQWLIHNSDSNKKTVGVFNATGKNIKSDLLKFDVVIIALHGKFGEDGKIQALLDLIGVPYTCSGVMASSLAMNKFWTLQLVESVGIKVPMTLVVRKNNKMNVSDIIRKISIPCIVKPNNSGSSVAISIVKHKKQLMKAINLAFQEDDRVLVQKYIKGREFTCSVLGNANHSKINALPVVEIIPGNEFFDYQAKYWSKKTQEIVPANITGTQNKMIKEGAIKIHQLLQCDGLTRSDFILSERNELFFLEINTIPGLTEVSLSPKSARASGMTNAELIDRLINLALDKNHSASN